MPANDLAGSSQDVRIARQLDRVKLPLCYKGNRPNLNGFRFCQIEARHIPVGIHASGNATGPLTISAMHLRFDGTINNDQPDFVIIFSQ